MKPEHAHHFDTNPENLLNAPVAGSDRMVLIEATPGVQTYQRESQLVRRDGEIENDNEVVRWVEYYLPQDMSRHVHRSAHVHLKKPMVFAEGSIAELG